MYIIAYYYYYKLLLQVIITSYTKSTSWNLFIICMFKHSHYYTVTSFSMAVHIYLIHQRKVVPFTEDQ